VAQSGEGLGEVLEAVGRHRAYLEGSGVLEARRTARARGRVRDVVERGFRRAAWTNPDVLAVMEDGVGRIPSGVETPYSLGARILDALLRSP
jgi:LAO/AO transport system kinase